MLRSLKDWQALIFLLRLRNLLLLTVRQKFFKNNRPLQNVIDYLIFLRKSLQQKSKQKTFTVLAKK